MDPAVCHGKPCIRGTRIFISCILDNLAARQSNEQIIEVYPGLTEEDIHAAISYAAELAHERTVYLDRSEGATRSADLETRRIVQVLKRHRLETVAWRAAPALL